MGTRRQGPSEFDKTEHCQHNCKCTSTTAEDGIHPHTPKVLYRKESLGIDDREPKTWHLACLYILGAMAHAIYAPCHYPLHLPITDYIEG